MTIETKFLYVNRDNDAEVELLEQHLSIGWRVVNFRSSMEEIQYTQDAPRRQEVVEWYYQLERMTSERGESDVLHSPGVQRARS